MKNPVRIVPIILALAFFSRCAVAQVSTRVSSVGPAEAVAGTPVTITVDLQQASGIDRILFLFRGFGESEYRRIEMDIAGNKATASLPGLVITPPFIEYYIVLHDNSGAYEAYPFSDSPDPLSNPPQNTQRMQVRVPATGDEQVLFLSPDPMNILSPDDVLLSVSLLRADSLVDRAATRLLLDSRDVTDRALFSGDLVSFVPANADLELPPGPHTATVILLDRNGNTYRTVSVSFSIRGESAFSSMVRSGDSFRYNATLQVESRHEDLGASGQWYNRTGFIFRGSTGDLRVRSNLFVTSDEKTSRQPQNRYFVGAELPWVKLGLGDTYPEFPELVLTGQRVRGLNSSFRLGAVNLDVAFGSVSRAIEGAELKRFPIDSLLHEQTTDPRAAYAQIDPRLWGKYSYGTYERNILAVRPSFGSGETWQLGFTWLRGKDDIGSIRYGVRPQENIVLGTDFFTRIDESRIEISGQAALSAFNSDISSGTFTEAHIDSVFPNERDAIISARNILKSIITFNENLRPLSFKKLSTLAGQASVALNYFDNALKFTYLYRGSDYTSFGQTYLRTDIRGFNILDRIRLLRNLLFATLGFERLNDNTGATKAATTTYTNLNAALTFYLITDFPGLTVGYSSFNNDNRLSVDSLSAVDDRTSRFYFQSSYNFDWEAHHTAFLTVSSSVRTDNTVRAQNIKNRVIALGLGSRFELPLQTEISLAFNINRLPSTTADSSRTFNYTMLAFHAKYGLLPNVLTIMATLGPTVGDFTRTVIDGGVEWQVTPPMSFALQVSYFNNPASQAESYVSLRYHYDF
jgi:hypothetical protein